MEFLSSGFQQLYSDLENDFFAWDYPGGGDYPSVEGAVENSDIYAGNRRLQIDSNENFELTTLLTSDYGKTYEPFACDYDNYNTIEFIDYDGELCTTTDWEQSFLDNYVEIPDALDLLPEKTPLCSDSCDIFLKESSENLNKFRPAAEDLVMATTETQITVSEPEKVFPCTYETCKKVYAKPAHLKAHIRRHLGDKPYICTWPDCTWKFSRSDELARHRRSHSGIKPYNCNYCSKSFSRSDHLAKHRKVHERKMAACKQKGIVLSNLPQVRPGRKPKNFCDI